MKAYEIRYQATKRLESLQLKIVWHLPRWVIRWAVVRATLHATNGKWSGEIVNEIPATEVSKRWGEGDK